MSTSCAGRQILYHSATREAPVASPNGPNLSLPISITPFVRFLLLCVDTEHLDSRVTPASVRIRGKAGKRPFGDRSLLGSAAPFPSPANGRLRESAGWRRIPSRSEPVLGWEFLLYPSHVFQTCQNLEEVV